LPLTILWACAVTPLSNRIQVGEEAFVIGVGEGRDGATDLFAAPAGGGGFVRLTFTRAEERKPRLSPAGTAVAFLRRNGTGADAGWSLVILDLRTNAERRASLPQGASAERIGWTPDGQVVLAAGRLYRMAEAAGDPVLAPVPDTETPAADSLTRELLGTPAVARVESCGTGSCVRTAAGELDSLGTGVTDAIRWGADSLGYFTTRGFQIRPLAGGASRRPAWSNAPAGLRELTYHPGRS
jgi:hypothetical protein